MTDRITLVKPLVVIYVELPFKELLFKILLFKKLNSKTTISRKEDLVPLIK